MSHATARPLPARGAVRPAALPILAALLLAAPGPSAGARPPLPAAIHGQPAAMLEQSARPETVIVRPLRSDSLTSTWTVDIVVGPEDTIRSLVRRPLGRHGSARTPGRHPVAFLMVGIETGKEVVELIEGHPEVIVFGMDYPFEGEFRLSGWSGFATAFGLRSMAFRTVRNAHIALDWLTRLPEADTSDVTMIAVSFGVFTGVPAAAADPKVTRLAVVQGGGGIDDVIAANAERLGVGFPAWLAGKLGEGILSPFEPNDHVGWLAPRPFILVSGESDRFFPAESVRSLYEAAREPKEWVKHESPHVMPDERELIRELTRILADRLYGGR